MSIHVACNLHPQKKRLNFFHDEKKPERVNAFLFIDETILIFSREVITSYHCEMMKLAILRC